MKEKIATLKHIYYTRGLRSIWRLFDTRYGLGRLECLFFCNWFNPLATLWLNFRCLPFKQAYKLPIFVYGQPRFYCLSGGINIEGEVSMGMIKFNVTLPGAPSNMSVQSELNIQGQVIFKGKGEIGTGNKIWVSFYGILEIGAVFKIADMCNIACFKSISCGDYFRVAHRTQIMDTNFHYIADFNKRIVNNHVGSIAIGRNCWIGNSSSIMPGTILPDYITIASHSLLGKDYGHLTPGCVIGGIPAKLLFENRYRVASPKANAQIGNYFRLTGEPYYQIPNEFEPEDYYTYE